MVQRIWTDVRRSISVAPFARYRSTLLVSLLALYLALFARSVQPLLEETPPTPARAPMQHQAEATAAEVDRRFKEAVAMLHAKQFEHAITALHRVLALAPRMPEAHVNMGFALLGRERPGAAGDFFNTAITLRPTQANAYYGLALALDAAGDRAGALGAMRSYVHLARADDQYVRKARSALWEWQEAAKPAVPAP